jgi:hypothetical protein
MSESQIIADGLYLAIQSAKEYRAFLSLHNPAKVADQDRVISVLTDEMNRHRGNK